MKRVTWLLASLSIALFVAGCGDDDSLPETPVLTPTSEAPTDLSREELISQADGICAEVNAAVGAVDSATTDAASQLGQKADLYEGMIERIRGLGDDEDAGLSEMLIAGDELVQAQQDAQLAAQREDDAGLATAEEDATAALASFQSAASEYGFEECGQGPSAPSTVPTDPGAAPVVPAPAVPTPIAPTPAPPAPAPPAGPSGGAGTGGGASGGDTGGDTGGGNAGGGGIGPG